MVQVPDRRSVEQVGLSRRRGPRASLSQMGGTVGRSVQDVGTGLREAENIVRRRELEREAENERKRARLDAARRNLELRRAENDIRAAGNDILARRKRQAGPKPSGFTQEFETDFDAAAQELLGSRAFNEEDVLRADAMVENLRRQFRNQASIFEHNAVVEGLAGDVDESLTGLALSVFNNPADFADSMEAGNAMITEAAAEGVLTPEGAREAKHGFEQNMAIQALRGLENPGDALRLLKAGEFDDAIRDPNVKKRLMNELEIDDRKMSTADRVALNEAVVSANKAAALEAAGIQVADFDTVVAEVEAFPDNARAQTALASLQEARDTGLEIREFMTSNDLAGQRSEILTKTQQAGTGQLTTDEAVKLGGMAKAHDAIVRGLQDKPFETAAQWGIIDPPSPISFKDPNSMIIRDQQAQQIQAAWGVRVSPLERGEIDSLEAALVGQDAPVVAALLSNLREGFGQDGVSDIAGQMRNVHGALSIALLHSASSPQAASQIVDGISLIENNTDMKPTKTDREGLLAEHYGNLFEALSDVRSPMIDAADAVYVKQAIRQGATSFDPGLYKDALRLVAGGRLMSDGSIEGGPFQFRGQTIFPVDFGATREDTINAFLSLRSDDLETFGSGIPVDTQNRVISAADMVSHGELVAVGIGKYLVRLGNGFVMQRGATGPDNKYVLDLLEFRNQRPQQITTRSEVDFIGNVEF